MMMMMMLMKIMIIMVWGAQKIFSMKRCISKSYTKTEQNGGCSSVNYYKCVPLFHLLKFPLQNYFVYSVAKKQNRTFAFLS